MAKNTKEDVAKNEVGRDDGVRGLSRNGCTYVETKTTSSENYSVVVGRISDATAEPPQLREFIAADQVSLRLVEQAAWLKFSDQ
ncbi:hypothetical protein V9T40_014714 [Parthenolecanium corni]|uniref:Uncharacterized protein n=1 Tax=Parthenolecanium corni TaxID=536013 RepID=A0AAN9TFP3_9HEMI